MNQEEAYDEVLILTLEAMNEARDLLIIEIAEKAGIEIDGTYEELKEGLKEQGYSLLVRVEPEEGIIPSQYIFITATDEIIASGKVDMEMELEEGGIKYTARHSELAEDALKTMNNAYAESLKESGS